MLMPLITLPIEHVISPLSTTHFRHALRMLDDAATRHAMPCRDYATTTPAPLFFIIAAGEALLIMARFAATLIFHAARFTAPRQPRRR